MFKNLLFPDLDKIFPNRETFCFIGASNSECDSRFVQTVEGNHSGYITKLLPGLSLWYIVTSLRKRIKRIISTWIYPIMFK